MAPYTRGVGKKSASVVLSALVLVTVAGCSSPTPEPTASPTRSASAAPSPTATPTPTQTDAGTPTAAPEPTSAPEPTTAPSPAPSPAPTEGGAAPVPAGTPLTAGDAYSACRTEAWSAAASAPEELTWTPFESAYVVQAGDAWRVYIEYVRTPADGSATFEGAASCIFRGTVEDRIVDRVGAGIREDPSSEEYWAPEVE